MFSDNSSFEMFDSVIADCQVTEDAISLKCYYMKAELAYIIFENVEDCQNYNHLKGNTISYIKAVDGTYEIHYVNEKIDPAIIKASTYRIEWK